MAEQADPGFFATLYSARALRRFKPDPVPDEVLFQVLDAAIRAPSGQNAQDWRFIIIRDPQTKQQMQQWAWETWSRYQPLYAAHPERLNDLPRTQRLSIKSVGDLAANLATVPALILVCGMKGRHHTPGGSTFPAVENLLLAARALGLGGSIFNLPLRRQELHDMLAIPENNEIYCIVPLGYPTDRHGPLQRKPLKDVAFLDRFGGRWAFAEEQPPEGWQDRWLPGQK